jgi:GT2 family glycosyltransferase
MNDHAHFVAINYHGSSALPAYLLSLQVQDRSSWRMTIVDNSEDPEEVRRLETMADPDPRVEVRAAPRNLGYFGGAHWLLSEAGAEPAIWTIVSNMDVRLAEPAFVARLLRMDGTAPVLAPLVVGAPDGRPQNPYLVTRPTVRKMHQLRLAFSRPALAQTCQLVARMAELLRPRCDVAGLAPRPVYAPHGSFIPVHRRYFAEGGSLQHPVFLFGEEITIAERCRRLGLPVMFEPTLRVIHDRNQTTGVWRSRRILRAQAEAADYGYRLIAAASE